MAIDYPALKTELTTDPAGIGYATAGSGDAVARLINAPRVASGKANVAGLERAVVLGRVDPGEYLALPAPERDLWRDITSLDPIPMTAEVKQQIAAVWGVGTTTRTRLVALQQKDASRAEELFGDGTVVSRRDILKAMRS